MAFTNTSVSDIAKEIRNRELQVGRLGLVVGGFSDDEVSDLRSQMKRIVRGSSCTTEAQTLTMAFALWICNSRISSQQAFWEEFENELALDANENRNFIYDDLLEPSFFLHDITLWLVSNKRRFVTSLMEERQAALATIAQVESFFVWYFRHSLDSPVTQEVLARYRGQSREQFPITAQALAALSDDCHRLARIVERAIPDDVLLSPSATGWVEYCQSIVRLFGEEFDPSKLRIVRNITALRRVILELQNHRTPAQFLKEIQRRANTVVQVPGSGVMSVSNIARWRQEEIVYGLYRIRQNTPQFKFGTRTRRSSRSPVHVAATGDA